VNKTDLSKITKGIWLTMGKHSPEILTGVGIAGMIAATVMAVKATPKALDLINEETPESDDVSFTKTDCVKIAWKCYIPSAVTITASIVCLIGASSVNVRRNAALVTAYTISESVLKEYQEKVIETIGEKKERTIRDEIAKDRINKDPVTSREVIVTEKGNTLCYDVISGRYFKSDIDKLKKTENELNRKLLDEMYVSLNDFYYEIGLKSTGIGDDLGWNVNDGFLCLSFSSQLADDGTPCLVIDYRVAPRYNYADMQ
jgi:hypothetical protein